MDDPWEEIRSEVQCPVCSKYMLPPIVMCKNGHNICVTCRQNMSICFECNDEFQDTRNTELEKIAKEVRVRCRFGCQKSLLLEEIPQHEAQCPDRTHKCPFSVTKHKCTWDGRDIIKHVKSSHPSLTINAAGKYRHNLQDMRTNSQWCHAVLALGNLFLCLTKTTEDMLYSFVLCVGDSAIKYKYRLTMRTPDGCHGSFSCLPAPYYEENINKIYDDECCLALSYHFVKKCIKDDKKVVLETEIFRAPS